MPEHPVAPANLAVLVTPPGPESLPLLGMSVAAGRPAFLRGSTALGSWVGLGHFEGPAQPVDAAGEPVDFERVVELNGSFALTVGPERLLLVLAGEAPFQPTVWFSFDRSELRYRTSGSEGVVRKRPTFLTVFTLDSYLDLARVSRVYERWGRRRRRELPGLLDVLGVPL